MSKLLGVFVSRKFWASIVGLLLLFLVPQFPLFERLNVDMIINPITQAAGVAVVIGSYILGTAVDNYKNMASADRKNKLIELITSRKLWAAVVGLVLILLKPFASDFPLTEDQVVNPIVELLSMVSLIATYVMGTAIEDASRNG